MKKMMAVMLTFAVIAAGSPRVSFAGTYFHLMKASAIHQSASISIDPNGVEPTVGVTDIAIITHSTADGTIIPARWQSWLPPEDWAPLTLGGGGNPAIQNGKLAGTSVITTGMSVNIAPQIGAFAFKNVGSGSALWLQALKAAFLGYNGSGVRMGGGFAGDVARNGVIQSPKEMFPGQGLGDVLKKATRATIGFAWVW